jgi:hypothetical protein
MAVAVQGKLDRGVPGEVLDVLWVRAASEQDCEAAMTEVMPAFSGNAARRSKGLKCLLTMFCVSRGVPLPVANTSPESS